MFSYIIMERFMPKVREDSWQADIDLFVCSFKDWHSHLVTGNPFISFWWVGLVSQEEEEKLSEAFNKICKAWVLETLVQEKSWVCG